jgi:hypothetical protein
LDFRTIIGFAKLPLFLSWSSFFPPLTKRPLFPLRYLKNALIATYTQREVMLQGPSMVLILHNGAWTLLKATAISYVPRWRRNKDCSELFSGPRKTKAFIQVRRLRSRTSASVKPDNLGERFYVKRGSCGWNIFEAIAASKSAVKGQPSRSNLTRNFCRHLTLIFTSLLRRLFRPLLRFLHLPTQNLLDLLERLLGQPLGLFPMLLCNLLQLLKL